MVKRIVGLCLSLWMLGGPAQAQMAESLKHQYHTPQELGASIVTDKELDKLEALMKDPSVKILCLQLWPEAMNAARARALLDWVSAGKTIWFYDARLGPWFGFDPILMSKEQFKNKPESADLGGKSVEGVATMAMGLGNNHELITGVESVSLFLPRLDQERYGGVWVKGDTVPLLRFKLDSPAVAAMRREGRGAIVYKPLLWPEALSGDRFQANLLEWSAGFQVPGPGGEGKFGRPPGPKAENVKGNPAVPLLSGPSTANITTPQVATNVSVAPNGVPGNATTASNSTGNDRVDTSGDGTLVGRVLTETFVFETGSESLKLGRGDVKLLTLGGSVGLDSLQTWDGQVRKGVLVIPSVKVDVNGQVRTILKKHLQKIQFEAPGPKNPNTKPQP